MLELQSRDPLGRGFCMIAAKALIYMKSHPIQFALLFLLVLAGCRASGNHTGLSQDFSHRAAIVAGVKHADRLRMYEGLPHPMFENDLYKHELTRNDLQLIHGERFYLEPIQPVEPDTSRLLELFVADGSLVEYSGNKRCGGFHADWCLRWEVGADVYECLLCFHCLEAKAFGPGTNLHCDMQTGIAEKFKSILHRYRTNRPEGAVIPVQP